MKISNFQFEEKTGSGLGTVFYATVDVESGALWWKETKTVKVAKNIAEHWFFVDTGRFTPGFEVENLSRGWGARNHTRL